MPTSLGEQPTSFHRQPGGRSPQRYTRRRRPIVLGLCGLVVVAAVVGAIIGSGSGRGTPAQSGRVRNAAVSGPKRSAESRFKLVSPSGASTPTGTAEVIRRGNTAAVALVGSGLAPNTKHDAYAVWLSDSPKGAVRIGFVNPGIGKNGRLETVGGLPADASHFRKLLVTLEKTANPLKPGKIVLEARLTGL